MPRTGETIRSAGDAIAKVVQQDPRTRLAEAALRALALFDDDTRFIYAAIFDTDFHKYSEDVLTLFRRVVKALVVRQAHSQV